MEIDKASHMIGDPSLRIAPRRVLASRTSLQVLVLFQSNIHSGSMSGS